VFDTNKTIGQWSREGVMVKGGVFNVPCRPSALVVRREERVVGNALTCLGRGDHRWGDPE
jgi:hypothetical protein